MTARLNLFAGFRLLTDDGRDAGATLGQKARALLAVLALARGAPVAKDRLAALLWGNRGDRQARDSLKHALAELRQTLGSGGAALMSDDRSARLDPSALEVDTIRFETLLAGADPQQQIDALALYTGDFLAGIALREEGFTEWQASEGLRLHDLAHAAAARILAAAQAAGDDARAETTARWLLADDPLSEDAVRALMRLHAGRGERTAALRLYARLQTLLGDELQATPEPETTALYQAIAAQTGNGPPPPSTAAGPSAGADGPSIAILPFRNESGDPAQDYFAAGIAEDIIIALSHFRWFRVIARTPSLAYRDTAQGLAPLARELGVRYILDGSVRKSSDRVRLTAALIEPETGLHVWGESYDRQLVDIFAIQDDLTRQVAGAIEPEVLRGESRRALTKAATNLDAYDCHMRGVWHHNLQGGAEDFSEAIRWQRQAIALDPGLARAYMILSRSLYARSLYGYSADLAQDAKDLLQAATRAVALEDRDAYAHYALCCAHLLNRQPAAAVVDAERAVELAPNLALAQNSLGWARIFAGQAAEAVAPIENAMRLSPRDPISYFFNSRLGLAHYHLGNFDLAVRYTQRSISARPRYFNLLVLLASLGQLRQMDEARALLPLVLANTPADPGGFWSHIFPYARSADRAAIEDGLHRAGLDPGKAFASRPPAAKVKSQ